MHWIKIITTNQKRSVLLLLAAQNCKRIYMRHMNFHFSLFVKPVHSVFLSQNKKLIALQNRIYDTPWSSNNDATMHILLYILFMEKSVYFCTTVWIRSNYSAYVSFTSVENLNMQNFILENVQFCAPKFHLFWSITILSSNEKRTWISSWNRE